MRRVVENSVPETPGQETGVRADDSEANETFVDGTGQPTVEEYRQKLFGAAYPVLTRIERGADTNNPVGLNGEDCQVLFAFISFQAAQYEYAATAVEQLTQRVAEAGNDWKREESGLVTPT